MHVNVYIYNLYIDYDYELPVYLFKGHLFKLIYREKRSTSNDVSENFQELNTVGEKLQNMLVSRTLKCLVALKTYRVWMMCDTF